MPFSHLPLAILYLTDRCNSRCVTCDYWRHGRDTMTLESVTRLLPGLEKLGTHLALLSGGEPLLNPDWLPIAQVLRASGMKLWLLTSGLSLAKHSLRVAELFDSVTVSLDGTDSATYQAIRGLDAFERVCQGIRQCAASGAPIGIRVTLQRTNFQQLPTFVELARALGARSVSFLAVDVANPHAFGRTDDFRTNLSLRADDVPILDSLIRSLERDRPEDFRSGFIAESPQKLHRIAQYFTAVQNRGAYPPVRCNAPEFSAVIGAAGQVQPCFFIPGPSDARVFAAGGDLPQQEILTALNQPDMVELRTAIRMGERAECKTCVCSMWRDPDNIEGATRSAVSMLGSIT